MSFSLLIAQDFLPSTLYTRSSVVPHDKPYYKHIDEKNSVEIIYTKENLVFAKHAAKIESPMHQDIKTFLAGNLMRDSMLDSFQSIIR